jgi:ParB family chromosome partitioning protein
VGKLSPLGKGLEAILPHSYFDADEKIRTLSISNISPNPYQPRIQFDEDAIQQLAHSIKKHGLTQPIVVRTKGSGYELIVGERRLRATKAAGLDKIKAIVKKVSDRESLQLALVENIDRENLNPIEEAKAFQRLSDNFGLTHQMIADTFKRSRSSVSNSVRLLKLPASIQAELLSGRLTQSHARTLLRLETEKEQLAFLNDIQQGKLSVRDIEQNTASRKKPYTALEVVDFSQLEKALKETFKLTPKIKGSWTKGSIQLKYTSKEELAHILEVFKTLQHK